MKKRISNLIVVVLLIVSMVCGCSKNVNQISKSSDDNVLSSNSSDLNNGNIEDMKQTVLGIKDINSYKIISDYESNANVEEMHTYLFGSYVQDDYINKMPIQWIALDKNEKENKILLLSKHIIDYKMFNDTGIDVIWEDCSLRSWLNNDFYNIAFSQEEKNNILSSKINNIEANDTEDKLFLLDREDIKKYFSCEKKEGYAEIGLDPYISKQAISSVTNYAYHMNEANNASNIRHVIEYGDYWLRGGFQWGKEQPDEVLADGTFGMGTIAAFGDIKGIRPALWVNADYLQDKINKNVYYYFANNNTELHLSATKPNSNDYTDGQYDYNYSKISADRGIYDKIESIKSSITKVVFDNEIEPRSCNRWFANCINLEYIDLSKLNTSNMQDMTEMFSNCKSLKEIDLSNFDFSKVGTYKTGPGGRHIAPYVSMMFNGCENLQTIYSNQDIQITSNYDGGTLSVMFEGCINLVGGNGTKYNNTFKDISFAIVDTDYQMGYFTYDPSRYYWQDGKYYINGNLQKNKWVTDTENKYYLDNDGNPLTNQWKDGKYLGKDGKMLKNTYTPDNQYVNKDGTVVDLEADFANIDKGTIQLNAWYRTDNGVWYYFEGDRDTLKKGWFTDPQDSQTYYLDPTNGVMLTGWQTIDGKEYYFSTRSASEPNWYYVEDSDIWLSYGKKIKALGSMFRDEKTPDGKRVDADGKLIK